VSDRRFSAPVTIKARGSAGEVTAVFSTSTVIDSVGDRVLSSAFKDGQHVPMVWSHDWSRPVGRGTVRVEPTRAVFEGRFFTTTTDGRDAYEIVKAMADLQEWSFGFQMLDSEAGSQGERVVTALDLFEVSPVLVGANRATSTLSIKRAAEAGPDRPDPALVAIRSQFYGRGRTDRADLIAIRARLAEEKAHERRILADIHATNTRMLAASGRGR
jgi:HK97 family phage prohead protease